MNEPALGFIGRRYEFSSPYSIDEIGRRLAKRVGWPMFSDRSVVGLYDRRGFQLRMNISYRNSFQTVLYGSMRASGVTTRITCTARVGTFVAAFMTIWFAAVLLMGGGVAVSVVAKIVAGAPLVQNLPGIAIFALMLLFGVGLVYSGRLWARDDEQKLIAFLEDTIDVTPL